MTNRLISPLLKHPASLLTLILLIAGLLAFFAKDLEVDASTDSLLLENDPDLIAYQKEQEIYKSDDFLVLAFKPSDGNALSLSSLELLSKAQKEINERGLKSISPLNAPLFKSEVKNLEERALDAKILEKAVAELEQNAFYMGNFIAKDKSSAAIIVYDVQDSSLDLLEGLALRLSDENNVFIAGGIKKVTRDMISYVKSDLLVYGLSLLALLFIALMIFFKSLSFVLVALFVCFVSLASSSGLFVLLGYKITVISSNYVALVLIITLSVIIHILTHLKEQAYLHPRSCNKLLLRQSLLVKAKPSFYAILTTVIGFISLVLSGIKPIKDLGVMMSIGISFSLFLAFALIACCFALLPRIKPTELKSMQGLLLFCANIAIKRRKIVYSLCVFILAISVFGIPKLEVENSFVNYFKESSDIKRGLVLIDQKLGGTLPLDILLDFKKAESSKVVDEFEAELAAVESLDEYFLDNRKIELARKIHALLEKSPYVGSTLDISSLVGFASIIKGGLLDDFELAFLAKNLDEGLKEQIINPYMSAKDNQLRFALRIKDSEKSLKRNEFLQELHKGLSELLEKENASFQIVGVMKLYNNLLQSLIHSQIDSLLFVVVVIFALFLIIFRSLRFSIIGIIANAVPLMLVFSLIGFLGIPLDLMSVTIAAICIGIGVDDIIHYVHRLKDELKHKSIEEAVKASHASIGGALYYTTATITLGFCVMLTSSFIPTIYFGLLTIFVLAVLLCGSLLLLPSLIISLHGKGYYKSHHKGK